MASVVPVQYADNGDTGEWMCEDAAERAKSTPNGIAYFAHGSTFCWAYRGETWVEVEERFRKARENPL